MRREHIGTAFIVKDGKTLFIWHRRLRSWLPPGGHLHENELPHEGARREVREETGLEICFIEQENYRVEEEFSRSIPRPYALLLEDEPDHQHIDYIYLAEPVGGVLAENPEESNGIRWFSAEEIERLDDILPDARALALHLLRDEKSPVFCSDSAACR